MAKPAKHTPKSKRTHLPALSPAALEIFKAQLDQMPQVSQAARDVVMQSMKAATNPNTESPLVVLKTLDPDEQQRAGEAMTGYSKTLGGVAARGQAKLLALSAPQSWSESLMGQTAQHHARRPISWQAK